MPHGFRTVATQLLDSRATSVEPQRTLKMSLFKKNQRPTRRLNAKGNTEIRPIIGTISIPNLDDFAEGDHDYVMGTNGLRDNPHQTQRRAVSDSQFRTKDFVEVAELPKVAVNKEKKALAKLVEGQISGPLTREQRLDAREFLSNKDRQEMATELMELREYDSPLTREQAMRKRLLEVKAGTLVSQLTALLRSV